MPHVLCSPVTRRAVLSLAAASGVVLVAPRALHAAARWDRTLILVELNGGNDGLNTLVPFTDPAYRKARPGLALGRDQVLPLTETLALHRSLEPLGAAWTAGDLAIVQSVGYPRPNRSHFRSIAIWETASDAEYVETQGWIDALFAAAPPGGAMADGLVLGKSAGPLAGGAGKVVILNRPERSLDRAAHMRPMQGQSSNPALAHILATRDTVQEAARAMLEVGQRVRVEGDFPAGPFGTQVRAVAQVLAAGIHVPVIKLSLGSFDTHANQAAVHARLLGQLGQGLAALRTALIQAGRWQSTLVMTYAEFGRRVAENGSGGTDHGTAAPHFVLGGAVRGGLHGRTPSLTALAEGDLIHTVDFRDLYATVARQWWSMSKALPGRRPLPLLKV